MIMLIVIPGLIQFINDPAHRWTTQFKVIYKHVIGWSQIEKVENGGVK